MSNISIAIWDRNLPVGTALAACHTFYFFTSLVISSLVHKLLRNKLFIFQIFEDFLDILMLLISNLILLWNVGKNMKKREPLKYWWKCKLAQPLWKTVWRFLKKLKIKLPSDPKILLLGIDLKKKKISIQKNTRTPIFIAALFIIAKLWKQTRRPTRYEWR